MSLQDRYIEQCTAEEVLSAIIDNLVQNPVSRTLVALNAMDPDIALGKQKVAQAITAKGVSTQPTQALETMAANISSIQQETIEIDGGEMYAKQLYGVKDNSIVPGYWNLYEVMAYLLSKTSTEQYSILLCEIPKGDAEYTFGTAVTPGSTPMGFVFSDDWQLNGEGSLNIHANTEASHTWNDDLDMKGNRWVAWLFAQVVEGATAPTVSLGAAATNCPQPRSIHIGRHMGTITATANGVLSEIVVTDGNVLDGFVSGGITQKWGRSVVVRNLGDVQSGAILYKAEGTENLYVKANKISGTFRCVDVTGNYTNSNLINLIVDCEELNSPLFDGSYGSTNLISIITIRAAKVASSLLNPPSYNTTKITNLKRLYLLDVDECTFEGSTGAQSYLITSGFTYVYVGYPSVYDKTKGVTFTSRYSDVTQAQNTFQYVTDLELQDGWCKPLDAHYFIALTEANMYSNILQRLKQDVAGCGNGVTITLGTTNLNKLTSADSVALLQSLRSTYGYTIQ